MEKPGRIVPAGCRAVGPSGHRAAGRALINKSCICDPAAVVTAGG